MEISFAHLPHPGERQTERIATLDWSARGIRGIRGICGIRGIRGAGLMVSSPRPKWPRAAALDL